MPRAGIVPGQGTFEPRAPRSRFTLYLHLRVIERAPESRGRGPAAPTANGRCRPPVPAGYCVRSRANERRSRPARRRSAPPGTRSSFPWGVLDLIVQAAQHEASRETDVLLHEARLDAGGSEPARVPALEEHRRARRRTARARSAQAPGSASCRMPFSTAAHSIRFEQVLPVAGAPRSCASCASCARSMNPWRKAISSGQHTFNPWRASIVSTKFAAASSDECVPVSSQATPRPRTSTRSLPRSGRRD